MKSYLVKKLVSLSRPAFLALPVVLSVCLANAIETKVKASPAVVAKPAKTEVATFAAGCFWGTEEFFRKIPGVKKTAVGYSGGTTANPVYEDMHDGHTGHAESVNVEFDPSLVTYEKLLDQFFKMHDPTTLNRQGNDTGTQYRSAIFAHGEAQMKQAKAFKEKVEASKAWKQPITTEISDAGKFWMAEDYHQQYLIKHPGGYDNHYFRKISFDKVENSKK